MHYSRYLAFCLWLIAALHSLRTPELCAREPDPIVITSPQPYQVWQRVGHVPASSTTQEVVGSSGSAFVTVAGKLPDGMTAEELTYNVTAISPQEPDRQTSGWQRVSDIAPASAWRGNAFEFQIVVPAGGWYRLELKMRDAINRQALGTSEPFGVGEVFVVAGQSYATNTNEELLQVNDEQQRVVAYDSAKGIWRVAHDPQPAPDQTDGGSIWPAVGDRLVADLQVPVAFANVAFGGTSSAQWLPEAGLHTQLRDVGKAVGRFRAVLWQQGESDVIAKTSVEQYVSNLQLIRKSAVRAWGFEPVWLLAKSTHHPTVYNDPMGEGQIRDAIEQLSQLPGFGVGPDTDTLQGENRGDVNSRRHFSAIGQVRAADLWYQVLAERLRQVPSGIDAASFLLSDLKLRQPAWQSEVVVRESSIVLQANPGADGFARLAFPPAEILQVTTADRSAMLRYALGKDGSLHFAHALLQSDLQGFMLRGIDSITEQDLFPPKDSPHSYQHRLGKPEQNLLYQPGRWFHDRNVEVTYRRDLSQEPLTTKGVTRGELPKTLARLRAGQPLTLGISGDSISTGLDASVVTQAPPFQPGYPELVVAQLQVDFASHVTLKNRAVAGWSVANGVADLEGLLAEQPHLIVVAYGMNDVGRRDPQWYADQTRTIIQQVHARSPDTEILLVATMLGNSQWVHTPREMFNLYRDELAALVGPGVALADLTTVWELLLKRKHDNDLTGNGLNHPNDFGHRLYAQALLQLLPQ